METFGDWLETELKVREWQLADLARAAGVETATLSRIRSGTRGAGPEVCVAIARGLGYDPVLVFRKAGLLPPATNPEEEPTFRQMRAVMEELTPEDRADVLAYAIWRRNQRTGR